MVEFLIIQKISKPRLTVINEPICPQLQATTDSASWSNSFVLPTPAVVSRGIGALTYSSCFKAPLASPWEELLSEEGDTGTRVTHAADGPLRRAHRKLEWRGVWVEGEWKVKPSFSPLPLISGSQSECKWRLSVGLVSTVGAGNFRSRGRLVPPKIKELGEQVKCISTVGKALEAESRTEPLCPARNPPVDW